MWPLGTCIFWSNMNDNQKLKILGPKLFLSFKSPRPIELDLWSWGKILFKFAPGSAFLHFTMHIWTLWCIGYVASIYSSPIVPRFPFDEFSPSHCILWPGTLPSCRCGRRWGGVVGNTLPKQRQMDARFLDLNLEQRDMQSKHSRNGLPPQEQHPDHKFCHRTPTVILLLWVWSILDSAQTSTSSFLPALWDPTPTPTNCLLLGSVLLALTHRKFLLFAAEESWSFSLLAFGSTHSYLSCLYPFLCGLALRPREHLNSKL